MPDGSEDSDDVPDSATRKWDESEFLDEKYKEPDASEYDIGPEIPEAPSPESADPQLQAQFWSLVVVFNIAILAISVGGMFMLFRGNLELGMQLFLAGVIVGAYGVYRYRTTKAALSDDQNG